MHSQEIAAWAARYRQFAEQECPQQPLYVAICQAIAADAELLALHAEIPPAQARPNLLLAALCMTNCWLNPGRRWRSTTRVSVAAVAPDAELPRLLRECNCWAMRASPRSCAATPRRPTSRGVVQLLRLAIDELVAQTGRRRAGACSISAAAPA